MMVSITHPVSPNNGETGWGTRTCYSVSTMDIPLDAKPDEVFMEEALRAAQRALEAGEVPVGAVVVCDGKIIGRGGNRNLGGSDPTAHAEIIALREAGAALGNHRLEGCELFATIEPCAMCAGALVHARLKRLVYGADDPKAGAVRSVLQVLNHPSLNHRMEVRSGVLAGRCGEIVQAFFRRRRGEKSTVVSSRFSAAEDFSDD
jgi:tRNA(adenine34) deaminase